jgi:hypothetical protein
LEEELQTLRDQWAEIRIQRMHHQIATLKAQVAEVQSLHRAQAGVINYLTTRPRPWTRTGF